MSFWKKIGLVDKNDFEMLLSEIETLKEDNRLIAEQNRQLIEVLINQRHEEVSSLIVSSIEKKFGETIAFIGKCSGDEISKAEECRAELSDLEGAVSRADMQIADELSLLIKTSEEKLLQVCDLIKAQSEDSLKKADLDKKFGESDKRLSERTEKLEKNIIEELQHICEFTENSILKTAKTEELEKVLSDIELIRESLGNLWTVMKAVWVDSLLDDVEKSIK